MNFLDCSQSFGGYTHDIDPTVEISYLFFCIFQLAERICLLLLLSSNWLIVIMQMSGDCSLDM